MIKIELENKKGALLFNKNRFGFSLEVQKRKAFDCAPGHAFLRADNKILKLMDIVEAKTEGGETALKISVENSPFFVYLCVSTAGEVFRLLWSFEEFGGAADFGVHYTLAEGERIYGLGELPNQEWPLNRDGNEINIPNFYTKDPFCNILSPILMFSGGGGLLYKTCNEMSLFCNHGGSGLLHVEVKNTGTVEQLLIGEENIRLAHLKIIELTGRPEALPPKELFEKPIWTTWVEYKMEVTQEKVLQYAAKIKEMGYPYSVIEIDDRWQSAYGDAEFDSIKFPNPGKMVEELHAMGFKVTLWVMPFVNKESCLYGEGAENDYFVKHYEGNFMGYSPEAKTASVKWWQGEGAMVDFSNPAAAQWYADNLKGLQKKYNIDGFKFDAGEGGFCEGTVNMGGLTPAEYTDAYIEAVKECSEYMEVRTGWFSQKAPLLFRQFDKFTRWGKDNGLHAVITQSLTMSSIGYPFILPDMIGGNQYGNLCDKQLFVRWTQANALLPTMQFSILPWNYDAEANAVCLKYTELHRLFSDYIYTCAEGYTKGGAPIVSALNFAYTEDEKTFDIDDEFLLGTHILVAPVLKENQFSREVYLPEGEWYNPWTDMTVKGGSTVTADAPIEVLPFFISESFFADTGCNKAEFLKRIKDILG